MQKRMLTFICLFFPAVFLMFTRWCIVKKRKNNHDAGCISCICEYCITNLLLNFVAVMVTCILFHHTESIEASVLQHADFACHYLILAIVLAVIEPVIEYLIRYRVFVEGKVPRVTLRMDLVLYFYTFFLFLLNFVRIFDNTFWGDEGYSIKLAKMSVSQMVEATAMDVHPPLYYLLIQLLYRCFGNNGMAYHLSAFIPYTIILIVACTAVKKRMGLIPATILVTMSSVMKNAVTYNVEVRMYALAAMLVLVAYIALYDIAKKNEVVSWVVFCVASLGAAYTHYYALISVAFLYLMLAPIAFNNSRIKRVVAAYIATIIGYLPWLMILVRSFTRTKNNWWLGDIPSIKDCIQFIWDYDWIVKAFIAALVMFVAYQLNIINVGKTDEGEKNRIHISIQLPGKVCRTNEMLWVFAGLISICGTVAVGLGLSYALRPFFIVRYLFPVTAMAYLLFGYCVSKMKLKKLWAVILVALILWNDMPVYFDTYKTDKQENTQTKAFLTAVEPAESAVIYTDNLHYGWTILSCYYPNKYVYTENVLDCLNADSSEVWLFLENQLDKETEYVFTSKGYELQEVYDGFFATATCYAYKLNHNNL